MVPEEEILEALFAGHEAIQPLLQIQEEIRREIGKPKRHVPLAQLDHAIVAQGRGFGAYQVETGSRGAREAGTL